MLRSTLLNRIQDERAPWDFLVIGGGATGLGIAVDAASRGYRTLLVEQYDFAKGTSSRSTKLVHGGVRYLRQGNVSLVTEALRERGLLLKNAPHIAHTRRFIIPAYQVWERPYYTIGLKLYDVLARQLRLESTRMLSRDQVIEQLGNVQPNKLRGGVQYVDGQFDDARLAINLAQTAWEHGACVINYMPVVALLKSNGRISGAVLRDKETGQEIEVQAKAVINATGVFCDAVRTMDEPAAPGMVTASQGSHLVLPREFLPGNSALMVPRTPDGRVLFAVPWHDAVIVGTTDLPVGDPSIEPRPMENEIDFILETAGSYLAKAPQRSDILSVYAGLRPLVRPRDVKSTAKISRDHTIAISPSGLVTVTGGKWTTYRHMAEQTVDEAEKIAGLSHRQCNTADLQIHGARPPQGSDVEDVYGSDSPSLLALQRSTPGLADRLHPRLPYTAAHVVWAARHEAARTVEDVLSRRTRALILNAQASLDAAARVAELLGDELGHDEAWQKASVAEFRTVAESYLPR